MRLVIVRSMAGILFAFLAAAAFAGDALDTSTIQRLISATEQLETLEKKYPELKDKEGGMAMFADGGKSFVAYLASTPAYGEIKSIAKANGFKSVETMVSTLIRVFTAKMAVEAEQYPQMAAMLQGGSNMDAKKQQMLASGMPQAVVDEQVAQMAAMSKMVEATQSVPAADKAFVKNNPALLAGLFEDDDEEAEE